MVIHVICKRNIYNRNAILQCLFHLPEFNKYFEENRDETETHPNRKGVVKKYKALWMDVMSKDSEVEISALPLKKSVCKNLTKYSQNM